MGALGSPSWGGPMNEKMIRSHRPRRCSSPPLSRAWRLSGLLRFAIVLISVVRLSRGLGVCGPACRSASRLDPGAVVLLRTGMAEPLVQDESRAGSLADAAVG